MKDSITDTDTTVADVSGARPASTSATGRSTSSGSDSNSRAGLADDTATTRAQHADVSADVADRPRPLQATRPQRTRRLPARLLSRVSVQRGGKELSFGRPSPFCPQLSRSLLAINAARCEYRSIGMASQDTPMAVDSSSESGSAVSSPRALPGRRSRASSPEAAVSPSTERRKEAAASPSTQRREDEPLSLIHI